MEPKSFWNFLKLNEHNMRILIADDSQENLDILMLIIDKLDVSIHHVQKCLTLQEVDFYLRNETYDLVFLDIRFTNGTIFDVLELLIKDQIVLPDIVFMTAYGSFEYATQAIKFACLDFINKPVKPVQFSEILDKYIKKQIDSVSQNKKISHLLEVLAAEIKENSKIAIRVPRGELKYCPLNQIVSITADGPTSKIQTLETEFTSTQSFSHFCEILLLGKEFIQISRFSLINSTQIASYSPKTRKLVTTKGTELLVSSRMAKNLSVLKSNNPLSILMDLFKKFI